MYRVKPTHTQEKNMIIESANKNVEVGGSFRTKGFRIEASAKAFKLLSSNPYKHKVRAVVREVTCNALDANIEAGVTDPPVVHLPTTLEPWFSVRDNGKGLSPEEIDNVYTVYFCSTKSDSNKYTGMLGIGAKSPLCLVDNFIVNSYQNATKSSYSAYKDADDLPQMALLSQVPTTEPSGLEVIVNVQGRTHEFQEEAVETYRWFDVVPTLNLPQVTEQINAARKYVISSDDYSFTPTYGSCRAVMGNVAYEIPTGYGLNLDGFIRFDIGDLDFDLGRESLSLDDKTKANLKAKIASVRSGLADHIVSTIEVQPTYFKKVVAFTAMNSGEIGNIITTNRDKFKYSVPLTSTAMMSFSRRYKTVSVESTQHLPIGPEVEYFKYKPKFSSRIKAYLKGKSKGRVILLNDSQIAETGIDLDVVRNLDILPKLVYEKRSATKKVKVKVMGSGGDWSESSVDTSQEYVYIDLKYGKPESYAGYHAVSTLVNQARKLGVKFTLYGLCSVKNKGLGIELTEYLKSKITVPTKLLLTAASHSNILSLIDDRFKEVPASSELQVLYRAIGTVEHDDSLDKLSEVYSEEYPLLEYIQFNYWSKPNVKAISSYIRKLS
jgi:hypothetical protein